MKAIILFDCYQRGGKTEQMIDAMGQEFVKSGMYVEKGLIVPNADYSFLEEFDVVVIGSPIYNLMLSKNVGTTLAQGNIVRNLTGKKIGLFVVCGGPEISAELLYLPQLRIPLLKHEVVAEKAFGMESKDNPEGPVDFAKAILESVD
jgi:hypothetical protein